MKKMEFSKKILFVTFILAVLIIAYAMFIQTLVILKDYHGGTEIVTALIVALGAEVTAGTGFYYWKAKRENELKLQKKFNEHYQPEEVGYEEEVV